MDIYCVAQIISAVKVFSVGSCVPLTYSHHCGSFLTLSFLALKDALGSSFIFPGPVLQSSISLSSPGFFYWRMTFEIKIWVLNMLIVKYFYMYLSASILS